jgi:hypothetical protein
MRSRNSLLLWIAILLYPHDALLAERFPQSIEQLTAEASVIVTGTVVDIEIRSEASQIEPGFGNSDWIVYHTIAIEHVDKGHIAGNSLTAKSFIKRKRLALLPGWSGHRPLPNHRQTVKVFLNQQGGEYLVVYPNGFVSDDSLHEFPGVAQMRNPRIPFTFVLPLEFWLLILVPAMAALMIWQFLRWRRRSKPVKPVS